MKIRNCKTITYRELTIEDRDGRAVVYRRYGGVVTVAWQVSWRSGFYDIEDAKSDYNEDELESAYRERCGYEG